MKKKSYICRTIFYKNQMGNVMGMVLSKMENSKVSYVFNIFYSITYFYNQFFTLIPLNFNLTINQ
jgi:hypothetical protein